MYIDIILTEVYNVIKIKKRDNKNRKYNPTTPGNAGRKEIKWKNTQSYIMRFTIAQ